MTVVIPLRKCAGCAKALRSMEEHQLGICRDCRSAEERARESAGDGEGGAA